MEIKTYKKYFLENAYVVHYTAQSDKREWELYGRVEEHLPDCLGDVQSERSREIKFSIICLGVLLDQEGNTCYLRSKSDNRPAMFLHLLTGNKPFERAKKLIQEWFNLCMACPVYPLAEMVRAQRENDLIICAPLVENGRIADPNSVELLSIDQGKIDESEAFFEPELPENFLGCPIAQALLGIHGGNRISPRILSEEGNS